MSFAVHQLRPDELPRIRRLGSLFAGEVNLFTGYNPTEHERLWRPMMEAGLADVFYTEDSVGELTGFLGASWIPDLYSGVSAAQSQFWFVDPAYRHTSIGVRLFAAFEAEGEKRKARKYFVGHKVGVNEAAMSAFFKRRGYIPGEILYWKNV